MPKFTNSKMLVISFGFGMVCAITFQPNKAESTPAAAKTNLPAYNIDSQEKAVKKTGSCLAVSEIVVGK